MTIWGGGWGGLATWQRALSLLRAGHRGFFHKEEQRSSQPALSTRGPQREAASRSLLSHYRVPDLRAQADPGPGTCRGHLHKAVLDAQWPLL